jgi:oligoendopeptidase F
MLIERSNVPENDTWDISKIFSSSSLWEAEFERLESTYQEISEFKGKLKDSFTIFYQATELLLRIVRELEKIYTYAKLLSDTDISDSKKSAFLEKASNLATKIATASSFYESELVSFDQKTIEEYLSNPLIQPYKRWLNEIIRFKPFTLSSAEEKILALGGEVYNASQKIFSQLLNADFTFGELEVEGKKQSLTHGTFITFLKSSNRQIRQTAFTQYYSVFESHQNALAASLSSAIKKDHFLAVSRGYKSSRTRALFSDNVTENVYDNLIDSVSKQLSVLHRYYDIRKRTSGLDSLRMFDTYYSLAPDPKINHSFEEAVNLLISAFKPFGDDYCSILKEGLTNQRWVDRYENKGKRSGAYSSGCYDSFPYILMNFKNNSLNDVFTLAHEAGHSMHSYFSNKYQSFQDHNYTIFVAEVASTLNEQLLYQHLRNFYANDKKMLIYLINHELDDIKATFFRQTMFAEFEKITHARVNIGQPLTLDDFKNIYTQLLAKYFGNSVKITALDSLECFRIPHFYSAFYVYKYATGICAAIALSQDIAKGDKDSTARYFNFLCSGCSKYSLDLLCDAGVDLRENKPIDQTIAHFNSLLDQLEQVI